MRLNRNAVLNGLTEWKSTQTVSVLTSSGKVQEIEVKVGNADVGGYNFLFADFPQLDDDYIILGISRFCLLETGEYQDSKGTSFHFYDFHLDNLTSVEDFIQFNGFDFSLIDKRAFRNRDARVFVQIDVYNTIVINLPQLL